MRTLRVLVVWLAWTGLVLLLGVTLMVARHEDSQAAGGLIGISISLPALAGMIVIIVAGSLFTNWWLDRRP